MNSHFGTRLSVDHGVDDCAGRRREHLFGLILPQATHVFEDDQRFPGREDEFFRFWKQVNAYMQTKPGYLGHELHRALAPGAAFRFVNVAQWESAEHFQAAHDAGFRALVGQPVWSAFPHHPVLYEVVHQGPAGARSVGA